MKNITTLILILSTLTASAQLSIQGGVNYSHFSHDHNYGKPIAGASVGVGYKIPLGKFDLVPTLSYEHKGSKSNVEQRNFGVYSVQFTPLFAYHAGQFAFLVGPYYERVIMASNTIFAGHDIRWDTHSWKFWRRSQLGISTGIQYDFIGAIVRLGYEYGISQVRNELNDYTGRPSFSLWHAHNELVSAKLIIPLTSKY